MLRKNLPDALLLLGAFTAVSLMLSGCAEAVSEEKKVIPVDISKACNMAFADQEDNDGTGGWTDQGERNDLYAFPVHQDAFASIGFRIADPAVNSGKSCIVLKGPERHRFPRKAIVDMGSTAAYVYLLHATAWTPGTGVAGEIEMDYEDGTDATLQVVIGKDVADWWYPRSQENAQLGWTGQNRMGVPVGLYVSRFANPSPQKKIGRLVLYAGDAVWGIAGISASNEDLAPSSSQQHSAEGEVPPPRSTSHYRKEIPLQNENSVDVHIELGAGRVFLERASEGRLFEIACDYPSGRGRQPSVSYQVTGGKGKLSVRAAKEEGHWKLWPWGDGKEDRFTLRLTDKVRLSISLQVGASSSHLDFTGLRLTNLKLDTGASDTRITFDRPNPEVLDVLDIDVGAATLKATGLGNANIRRFSFNGGVGGYSLDFGGTARRRTDVDISMGIGSLTLAVPSGLGTRIQTAETFLTSTTIKGFEKKGRFYLNRSHGTSEGELSVRIDQAIGSLEIISNGE